MTSLPPTPLQRSREEGGWRRWLSERWQDDRWFAIGALWLVALALGYVGFARYYAGIGEPRSPADLLYMTVQLFTLESGAVSGRVGWPLEIARWLAPVVAAYTALQTLALIFQEQMLLTRLHFFSDHTIVAGLGRKGFRLAQGFRQRGEPVVAIERNEENDLIEAARAEGIVVLTGDATRPELLRRARVHTAKRVIAVCGDDGVNAEVGVRTAQLAGDRRRSALQCVLHVTHPELCTLLREREIASGASEGFRLEFFNIFDTGARALLDQFPPFDETSGDPWHVLIVGLGRLGENVMVQMAKRWARARTEIANRGRGPERRQRGSWLLELWALLVAPPSRTPTPAAPEPRPRLTIIDLDADEKVASLCLRYPRLGEACDIVTRSMDVRGPAFQRGDFLHAANGASDLTGIYVCLDDDALGLSTALTLRDQMRGRDIPIVVRMEQDAGLARLVEGMHPQDKAYKNLHAFGLLDRTCTPDLVLAGTHEILARAVHAGYLSALGIGPGEEAPAAVPWHALPEEYRESCRRQADRIGEKLRAVGCAVAPLSDWNAEPLQFTEDEELVLAQMEHARWLEERRADGWTLGPRDEEARTNPNLKPWEELPAEVKLLNREIVRALPASLAEVGLQLYRTTRSS